MMNGMQIGEEGQSHSQLIGAIILISISFTIVIFGLYQNNTDIRGSAIFMGGVFVIVGIINLAMYILELKENKEVLLLENEEFKVTSKNGEHKMEWK